MKHKKSLKTLKIKLLNTLMVHGKKNTVEKILLSSIKFICKSQSSHLENLFKLAFINSTPIFKLNEQIVKKGKRKIKKQIPFFLIDDASRLSHGFKTIKVSSYKSRNSEPFFKSLSVEILNLTNEKSNSILSNKETKNQILLNRRYLSKFRW